VTCDVGGCANKDQEIGHILNYLRKDKNSGAGGTNKKGSETNLTANYFTIYCRVPKTDQVMLCIHESYEDGIKNYNILWHE